MRAPFRLREAACREVDVARTGQVLYRSSSSITATAAQFSGAHTNRSPPRPPRAEQPWRRANARDPLPQGIQWHPAAASVSDSRLPQPGSPTAAFGCAAPPQAALSSVLGGKRSPMKKAAQGEPTAFVSAELAPWRLYFPRPGTRRPRAAPSRGRAGAAFDAAAASTAPSPCRAAARWWLRSALRRDVSVNAAPVTLVQALKRKMDFTIQKAVELGVPRQPVLREPACASRKARQRSSRTGSGSRFCLRAMRPAGSEIRDRVALTATARRRIKILPLSGSEKTSTTGTVVLAAGPEADSATAKSNRCCGRASCRCGRPASCAPRRRRSPRWPPRTRSREISSNVATP